MDLLHVFTLRQLHVIGEHATGCFFLSPPPLCLLSPLLLLLSPLSLLPHSLVVLSLLVGNKVLLLVTLSDGDLVGELEVVLLFF